MILRVLVSGLLARRLLGVALWLALRPGGWAVIVAGVLVWLQATA